MKKISLNIDSNPDTLDLADECIRALCLLTPLSAVEVNGVRQAVKEALNNVIIHSYQGQYNCLIDLIVSLQDDDLVISIKDTGIGMDPKLLEMDRSAVVDVDPSDIENIPNGGWGLYLIKELMDSISYRTEAGIHTLEMKKYF
jgi:serine/threonine-protein kinase RsbW